MRATQVALVLADQWLLGASGDTGARLLARVRDLHPARQAGAPDRLGRLALRADDGGDQGGDGTRADRLLPDEAVALTGRVLPPHHQRVHPRVVALRHVRAPGGRGRGAAGRRARTSSPACWHATASRTSFHPCDSEAGRRLLRRARHRRHGQAGRVPARGQAARGPDQRASSPTRTESPRSLGRQARLRPDHHRRGAGRPGGLGVRRVRGAARRSRSSGGDRRPGGLQLPDPQLPRVLARGERRRAGAARLPAGVGVRHPVPADARR